MSVIKKSVCVLLFLLLFCFYSYSAAPITGMGKTLDEARISVLEALSVRVGASSVRVSSAMTENEFFSRIEKESLISLLPDTYDIEYEKKGSMYYAEFCFRDDVRDDYVAAARESAAYADSLLAGTDVASGIRDGKYLEILSYYKTLYANLRNHESYRSIAIFLGASPEETGAQPEAGILSIEVEYIRFVTENEDNIKTAMAMEGSSDAYLSSVASASESLGEIINRSVQTNRSATEQSMAIEEEVARRVKMILDSVSDSPSVLSDDSAADSQEDMNSLKSTYVSLKTVYDGYMDLVDAINDSVATLYDNGIAEIDSREFYISELSKGVPTEKALKARQEEKDELKEQLYTNAYNLIAYVYGELHPVFETAYNNYVNLSKTILRRQYEASIENGLLKVIKCGFDGRDLEFYLDVIDFNGFEYNLRIPYRSLTGEEPASSSNSKKYMEYETDVETYEKLLSENPESVLNLIVKFSLKSDQGTWYRSIGLVEGVSKRKGNPALNVEKADGGKYDMTRIDCSDFADESATMREVMNTQILTYGEAEKQREAEEKKAAKEAEKEARRKNNYGFVVFPWIIPPIPGLDIVTIDVVSPGFSYQIELGKTISSHSYWSGTFAAKLSPTLGRISFPMLVEAGVNAGNFSDLKPLISAGAFCGIELGVDSIDDRKSFLFDVIAGIDVKVKFPFSGVGTYIKGLCGYEILHKNWWINMSILMGF